MKTLALSKFCCLTCAIATADSTTRRAELAEVPAMLDDANPTN
jgi:hypothetical protein